jgi:hypothetical protein
MRECLILTLSILWNPDINKIKRTSNTPSVFLGFYPIISIYSYNSIL